VTDWIETERTRMKPDSKTLSHPSRRKLASIARQEAELQLRGNANRAGSAIERYLSVFREALNLNCETTRYSDLNTGYRWCCAFVYYCCLQAGFRFPPKPELDYRYTLAAVPAWHHWAMTDGFLLPADSATPEAGDIVPFNCVDVGQPLDHIGIALEITPAFVLCAEGGNENRTGLFERPFTCIAGYVRLPQTC